MVVEIGYSSRALSCKVFGKEASPRASVPSNKSTGGSSTIYTRESVHVTTLGRMAEFEETLLVPTVKVSITDMSRVS